MAMYLDPWSHPDAWDHVVFAGDLETPGVATVGKWERENEYDIKTGKGTAGATITLKGQPPAKGPITFKVWTRDQMLAFDPILDALKLDPTKIANTTKANAATTSATTSANAASGFPKDTTPATPTAPALNKDSAILIFHPALADIGVDSVLPPEKLGTWEMQSDFSFTRTIDFVEFSVPLSSSIATTPTGPAPGAQPVVPAAGGSEAPAFASAEASAEATGQDAQGSWGAP